MNRAGSVWYSQGSNVKKGCPMKVHAFLSRKTSTWLVAITAAALVLGWTAWAGDSSGSWTQWGGSHQDFKADSKGLADTWPEDGPNKIWTRELGDGYSAILAEGGRLYTMYRTGDQESVVCLDAKTGKTIWEHKYDHSPAEGHIAQFGEGPRSTPLISRIGLEPD